MESINKDTTACASIASKPGNFGANFHNSAYKHLNLNWVYLPRKVVSAAVRPGFYQRNDMGISTNYQIPNRLYIESIYPKPFNSLLTVEFETENMGLYSLNIYNLNGELVSNINSVIQEKGINRIIFNSASLASGIYFINLSTEGHQVFRKVTLIK